MLPLKLVRSLVLRETINDPLHLHQSNANYKEEEEEEIPCLIFLPTHEIIHETYKLAMIARDMGIDFTPDLSLSTIIFSSPSHPNNPLISLPFPSLSSAPISHLRRFVRFSKGLFKLSSSPTSPLPHALLHTRSPSLFSRLSRNRIQDIDAFSRVLTSGGWSMFKANNKNNGGRSSSSSLSLCCYVFRKVEANRVRAGWWRPKGVVAGNGDFGRVRELRLPDMDFRNAPLRVLHYVLLMTDDLFYLCVDA